MWAWTVITPVIGLCLVAGWPVARYAQKQRDEARAVSTLGDIRRAQERFRTRNDGYATDLATLLAPCPGQTADLPAAILDQLTEAGYALTLRQATDAEEMGRDCHGRPLASDYYVAAAPRTAWEVAGKALAARSDGPFHVFVDGVPPRESDMTKGLATTVDRLDTFRIP
jgi:type II secretory pathway pseudopilin PulG